MCRFPVRSAEGSTTAIHTLELVGLLVLILGGSSGTFVTSLVGLACFPQLDVLAWVLPLWSLSPSPSVESPPQQVGQPAAKHSLASSRQVDPIPP